VHRHVDTLLGERGDRAVGDAARDDVVAHVPRSVVTLSAKPCIVRPWARRTPMAAILRGFGPVGVDPHTGILGEPARAGEPELGERVDEQTLDGTDVASDPLALGTERIG
jgi:hypothetical protein